VGAKARRPFSFPLHREVRFHIPLARREHIHSKAAGFICPPGGLFRARLALRFLTWAVSADADQLPEPFPSRADRGRGTPPVGFFLRIDLFVLTIAFIQI
jgi:hypothetical protein